MNFIQVGKHRINMTHVTQITAGTGWVARWDDATRGYTTLQDAQAAGESYPQVEIFFVGDTDKASITLTHEEVQIFEAAYLHLMSGYPIG